MNNEEYIEVWDWEKAVPTGKSVLRQIAHKQGIAHEGVHLWIIRENNKKFEILLQKRAKNKDLYPGYLDITVGGHVPFGLQKNKIQKEASEELGIEPLDNDMIDLGYYRYEEKDEINNFFHREFQHVYLLCDNRKLDNYCFNDGEVEAIYALLFEDFKSIFYKKSTIDSEFYNGKKISRTKITKSDFHPLFFTSPMENYLKTLFQAIECYIKTGNSKEVSKFSKIL